LNLAKFDDQLPLYALGVIGYDAHGEFLVEECRQFPSINTDQLRRSKDQGTSYTDVFNVQSTGKRTFFHYRGANRLFVPESVDLDRVPVDIFHLGYLLLLDGMDAPDPQFTTVAARFLCEVQKRGIKTSIDLVSENSDRFSRIVPPALPYTNYCIINDFEAEKLSGIPIRDGNEIIPQNLERIAASLFEHGVNDLVVVHFPEGAYLRTRDGQEILQPSLDLPESYIVGSTGAGDSCCAGVLYGLYRGWSYERTLQFAMCAGGMNLSDLTTVGGIRPWKEIFQMQERFPYRKDLA
jgi:sugar/nucleoside kinase (ribokinase family)